MKAQNVLYSILFSLCTLLSFGQAESQFKTLENLGEGAIFTEYWSIQKAEGKFSGTKKSDKQELKLENNMHGKLSSFFLTDIGSDKPDANMGFGWLEPNHYSEPSTFHSSRHSKAYTILNGVFYGLSGVEDPNNITDFTIKYMFVADAKNTEGGEKKKLSLKEKMAALKAMSKAGGFPIDLQDKDHYALLKAYFAEMKVKQKKATANFSAETKKEIAIIAQAAADKKAGNKAKNAAYWNSEEGKRVLAKGNGGSDKNWVTIKNTSSNRIYVINENGTSSPISAGGSNKFKCNSNLYHCSKDAHNTYKVKGSLIYSANAKCGGTISIK